MPIDSSMIPTYLQILQFGKLPAYSALTLIQSAAQSSQAAQTSAANTSEPAPPLPPGPVSGAETPPEPAGSGQIIDIRV